MMASNTKKILILGLSLILLLLLIGIQLFELRKIPDADWEKSLYYGSKEPYGTYLFESLLKEKYGEDKIIHYNKDITFGDIDKDSLLYIYISNVSHLDNEHIDSIRHIVSKGNTALIISPVYSLDFNEDKVYQVEEDLTFENITEAIEEEERDTFDYRPEYEDEEFIDSFYFSSYTEYDSSFNFNYSIKNSNSDTFNFKNYTKNKKFPSNRSFNYFNEHTSDEIEKVSSFFDSLSFMAKIKIDEGSCYVHLIPDLFSNRNADQAYYLNNFNEVFRHFDADKIVLDHPKYSFTMLDRISEGPLGFIMSNSQLRWAYFVMLASFFTYLIFGGKRKQKAIPVKNTIDNTSLEHVRMMSELYRNQNQNEKLVAHFENNFYHRMEQKYFVIKDSENYSTVLAKKSKTDKETIDRILNKFRSALTHEFNEDQLIVLYRQIEKFYKNCK